MAEVPGHSVSGSVLAKGPNVNDSSAARILLREIFGGDATAQAARVTAQMVFHELLISHRGGHQDVSPASPFDEKAGDVLAVFGHKLGGGRFMVNVGSINGCTSIEQQSRDLDSAAKVQRSLAVAAPGVNEAG